MGAPGKTGRILSKWQYFSKKPANLSRDLQAFYLFTLRCLNPLSMGWEHTRRITMTAMRKNEELSAKEAGANTFSKENVVPPLPYSAFSNQSRNAACGARQGLIQC